jgi:hypothetical protein
MNRAIPIGRSILVFLAAMIGLVVVAAVAGHVVTALLQTRGVSQAHDFALGVLGIIAAVGAYFAPISPTWPKPVRTGARLLTVTAVLAGGVFYTAALGLAIHGK